MAILDQQRIGLSPVPIGYTTEWDKNGLSLQFGPSYSGHMSTPPSPPLDGASAVDSITGIHVFRAPCVWKQGEVEGASSDYRFPDRQTSSQALVPFATL
jgi:hypothetical protein